MSDGLSFVARASDRSLDGREVVAVLDPCDVPAVGREPLRSVLRPGHVRRAVELDVVVVVEHDELPEPEVAGEARGLRGDALLEVAVRGDDVRPVVDQLVARPVELVGEPPLRDGHAHGVGEALAERAGRRLDARREAVLRVARRPRAPLPELLELLEPEVVAGEVEERVQEHRGVARGQDEPVAVRPVGCGRARGAGSGSTGRRPSARRPSARPGCPELAFWTASIDSVRIVSIASRSRVGAMRWNRTNALRSRP